MSGSTENFAQYFSRSSGFNEVYEEGMKLVEEVSDYLEGKGRIAARSLPRELSLAYASESMRLTTRLMQVASWLMVQRSVREGHFTLQQSLDEKYILRISPNSDTDEELLLKLPRTFQNLVNRSRKLTNRVQLIDTHLRDDYTSSITIFNPVAKEIENIQNAFS